MTTPAAAASPAPAPTSPASSLPGHVLVALALVYVIWSSTYLAIRVMVRELPPLATGGVRFVIAGAVLLAIQRARGVVLPTRREWIAAVPVGVLLFGVGNGFVMHAERSISSGIAAVVCGTTPLWAGVLGPIFGERATRREWLGMALGFAGVVVLSAGGDLTSDPIAAALLLIAPLGWAAGSLWARKLPVARGPSGAATQMIAGGVVMLAVGALSGEHAPEVISWSSAFAFVYLVVLGSLVGFSAYAHLLQNARPALAMSYAYVNPALAVLLGAVLGAEHVGLEVIAATALIVGAVVLLVRGRR
ncbi:drug/metabolite exporter YedA [Sandaracinus amylolyticus]|uniref:Permease of the drug/metabolite transporter (DMT) superfamily n=1 Tax=Sandaracinus amylolyticus TaxID=927083 RepID=A0A0F6W825_9BACT|nr:drug/metabolite exporter YedA [Sandaracinus amylolyticus]AKF09715.1 Permease of the drug/metabolite transporter (DMT) superfamily [Sandaracinus amylolyticus]